MQITYHIVNSDPKKNSRQQAEEVCQKLAGEWQIVSAVPAGEAVHYILVEADMHPELTDEDAQVIRDNLDATHGEKHE